jgi:hypothetical protein
MDEQRNTAPEEEKENKSQWQQTKENWYDKIPVTLKQMDMIVWICWGLIGLTVVAVALDAMDIWHLFG